METDQPSGFNWKAVPRGLRWIAFSPIMFLWGALATHTSSDLEYGIQITVSGAWSALGVISGIGTIAGASWAESLQKVLTWILAAFFTLLSAVLIYIAFTWL